MSTGGSARHADGDASLAVLLRTWRERALLTQEQLATRAGLGVRTVRRLESDDLRHPRAESVRLLADALDLTAAERAQLGAAARGGRATAVPPRQLPAPPQMFIGRTSELADLDRVSESSTVVITAIDGMAGIGKTALAVHAAHRLAGRYPDGQLFIDLHGYTEGIPPVEPGEALERMLRALGIPGEQVPLGLDDRAALYRSQLADQRMLIVLDNASTEAQVAPLLPGAAGCAVLITSRRRLTGLDHTRMISLDILSLPDAIALFAHIVGEERLTDHPPELVAETVNLCGRLPLAVRIAAARLGAHHAWTVSDLVQRLRGGQHRLAELEAGQRSVTTALDLSYQQLTKQARRLYRLLGLHPGPDITAYTAAALTEVAVVPARRLLDYLLDSHLLQEPAPGRYVLHDLVRAHATAIAATEPEATRRAALNRLLDHYRHLASIAMDTAYPYERKRRPGVPPAGTPSPDLRGPTQATAWLDTELPNLFATARHAAEHGWPEHARHLSATLHRHLRARGRYREAETLHRQALTTILTAGNRVNGLDALTDLGEVHLLQGRYEQAIDDFGQALEIARAIRRCAGESEALLGLGHVHLMQGRHEQAIDHYRQALETARTTGHRAGELDALLGLGHVHRMQGRYEQTVNHYRQALEIAHATGHHGGEVTALYGLGHIHLVQGHHERAFDHYRQALETARTTGHRGGELNALLSLGHVQRMQGQYEQAIDYYWQALEIARTTGHHDGELNALTGLGHLHRMQGRHEQVTYYYQHVLDLARENSDRNWQFEAMQGLGRLHHATGHPETAVAHHRQALELATALRQPADQARAHDGLAHACYALNRHEQARQHWQHVLAILTSLGTDHTVDEQANVSTIRTHLATLDPPQRCHQGDP